MMLYKEFTELSPKKTLLTKEKRNKIVKSNAMNIIFECSFKTVNFHATTKYRILNKKY